MKLIPIGPHVRARACDRVFLFVSIVPRPTGVKWIADIGLISKRTQ
jgi:hypothetical protein